MYIYGIINRGKGGSFFTKFSLGFDIFVFFSYPKKFFVEFLPPFPLYII
jgi:hypothetical protein